MATENTTFSGIAIEEYNESTAFTVEASDRRFLKKESNVYRRLMEDLEDEEDPSCWYTTHFVALGMVVILGPMAALVATLKFERTRHHWVVVTLRGWQWVVMVMGVVFGLSALQIVTFVVLAPVKWWWKSHKYVVYFVNEIKLCVDVTLWLGLGLVAWYLWFKPRLMNVKGDVPIILAHHISRLLIALVVGSSLWVLKNLLYLKLKADLHYDQFFAKIQRTVVDFHCLQIIKSNGSWKFLNSEKNKRKVAMEMGTMNERHMVGKNIWMDVAMMNNQTVPIWLTRQLAHNCLKKLLQWPRYLDATADDQKLLRESTKLLSQVSRGGERSDILPDNLRHYRLGDDELKFLFEIFAKDEEKKKRNVEGQPAETITTRQFLSWAVVAYRNCWDLELTLLSSERMFIKLNRILNVFLLTVMLIIWLLLSKIMDTAQLALLFTPFVAASFIFGDSCKKMFEGLIFVFVRHPFDVGDLVDVDGDCMKVSKINILTTEFLIKNATGDKKAVCPNSLLADTKNFKLDVTADKADCLDFIIPYSTPNEDITDLILKLEKTLDDDLIFWPSGNVLKTDIIGKEAIKMAVNLRYLVPYLTAEKKAKHRSNILTEIIEFTKEMETNIQRWPSSMNDHLVLRVEFTLLPKLTAGALQEINDLKHKIWKAYEEQYIKLLLKSLHGKQIKMVLYLKYSNGCLKDRDAQKLQVYGNIRTFTDHQIDLRETDFGGSFIGPDERETRRLRRGS